MEINKNLCVDGMNCAMGGIHAPKLKMCPRLEVETLGKIKIKKN